MLIETKPRLTDAEAIDRFLTDLRHAHIDPGFLHILPALNMTGGYLSPDLNKVLEIVRSDAPVRVRAKQTVAILSQALAQSNAKLLRS
jgi:hypothetical protein